MQHISSIPAFASALRENIALVLVGKQRAVELVTVALVANGHVLLQDLPGVGKTTLAKALAFSITGWYSRIQFTPDLKPSDIIGETWFSQKTQDYRIRNGPIYTNFLLADELNRAAPRTQAALLEAMQERQASIDGYTMVLPRPFMVLATQNPSNGAGTYPLLESQLDRFLLRTTLGYPNRDEEEALLARGQHDALFGEISAIATVEEVVALQQQVHNVAVEPSERQLILDIVHGTRSHPGVRLAVSPRGSLDLYRAAQALAAIRGRDAVVAEDVRALALPVLAHRVWLTQAAIVEGLTEEGLIGGLAG
jgi:MoxR-like ATPase